MKTKITKLPKSKIEIEGEIGADVFEGYFKQALKNLGERTEINGFRKGKVPENILLSKIPESKILEEMAELAIQENYPKMLEHEKIDAIGRPEVTITKLARNNPFGFKITIEVLPDVTLPEYKDIAKKIITELKATEKAIKVTEKELEDTILDIRKSRAPKKHMAEEVENTDALPPLDDEFVRTLGPFENVADFTEKLKANIKLEKENLEREKKRLKVIEEILKHTVIDTPDILVEIELDKILYRMQADIAAMGLKFEDYLKHINRTVEDLQKEFLNDALKRANLALVLNEIAKTENLVPDPDQVEKEIAAILEQYKDADRERAAMHALNVLTNEKVFEFLENQ